MNLRSFKDFLQGSCVLLVWAILFWLVYVVCQVHQYNQNGWHFIVWHTYLAPYVFIYTILLIVVHCRQKSGLCFWAIFAVNTSLFLAESIHTILYSKGNLYDVFNYKSNNYYKVWPSNSTHVIDNPECRYERHTNSLGFSDREWTKEKSDSVRVFTLGDSFTEGDGSPYDSAYPAQLYKLLNSSEGITKWQIFNAGICGSDPVFCYKNLEERLVQYQPDLIVQTISVNDVFTDIGVRGGFERFSSSGTVQCRALPPWFYPAAFSHIAEKLINKIWHLNRFAPLGMGDDYRSEADQLQTILVNRFDSLATVHQFKVLWVLLPLKEEVRDDKYLFEFTAVKNAVSKSSHSSLIDLLPLYRKYMKENNTNHVSVYLKNDGHHNARGYHMMAECIASSITEF